MFVFANAEKNVYAYVNDQASQSKRIFGVRQLLSENRWSE